MRRADTLLTSIQDWGKRQATGKEHRQLERRMRCKSPVRFGGGPGEKAA